MKKVFLDTNILMDAIQFREHGAEANTILDLARIGVIHVYAAAMSFATISYLLRRYTKEQLHQVFVRLGRIVDPLPVDASQFRNAVLYGPVNDFEDMMQYQCAKAASCDVIVTNNGKDYAEFCDIPFMTAAEFLEEWIK
jgi:predicted nucleic acid-binding protein